MRINIHSMQDGFTLIELMIVIVISSILVTIALPTYQDFISKTQINSAYQTLSTLKKFIDLKLYNNDDITSIADIGWLSGSSDIIQSDPTVTVDPSTREALLQAIIDGRAHPLAKGVTIQLLRAVNGHWSCVIIKSNTGGWKDSMAPTHCLVVNN